MKKSFIAAFIVFWTWNVCNGQNYRSRQDGNWNNATTWEVFVGGSWVDLESGSAGIYQNVIPSSASGTITIINGDIVNIPAAYSVTIDETTVNAGGRISVFGSGTLNIASVANALVVNGSVVGQNLSSITGTNGTNVVFNSNATYYHQFTTTEGVIPRATWASDAELEVQGYTTFTTATAAGNWNQSFGTVIWNCTSQTSTVNLVGRLTTVNGNLQVSSTNTGILQFATSTNPTINIAGDFEVENSSRIIITASSSPGVNVNVGGNFNFSPTNSSTSTLSTTGHAIINITGNFVMNASGSTLYLNNSSGTTGTGTLNIQGNFDLVAGTIREGANDAKAPNGNINFVTTGGGTTHTFENTGSIINKINYRLQSANDTLHVIGESEIVGNTGSTYTQFGGVLIVESTHTNGAIQTGSGPGAGNIRTATRTYNAGSQIIYQGNSAQAIGNGQTSATIVVIDNPSGVRLNNASSSLVTVGGLIVEQGNLTIRNDNLVVSGTSELTGGNILVSSADAARSFTTDDLILSGGSVFATGSSFAMTVTVNNTIQINSGGLTISNTSQLITLNANGDIDLAGGNITLNSGSANLTFNIQGDITGTGFFNFIDNNNNVNILGSGAFSRDFPVSGAFSLENVTVTRASGSVTFAEEMTITNNFTINDGTAVIEAEATIVGDLNIATGGTFDFSGQTLNLQSQFNNTLSGGQLASSTASILNIEGSGTLGLLNFASGANTLGKLILDRATAGLLVAVNSTLTISDSLLLDDGEFQNTSGLTFSSGAVVHHHSNASLIGAVPAGGPYDLTYLGTTSTTAAEATGNIGVLRSEVTGTVTLASNLAAADSINIVSGSFTCGANQVSTGVFLNSSTFNAPSSTLSVADNFINDGTFDANGGTVTFTGTSTISGTTATVFHSIAINALASVVPPSFIELTGDFTNNGSFNNVADDTILFSGVVLQSIGGAAATTFYNLNVTNATIPVSVAVESTAINLQGVLTLSAGAQFDADGLADTGVMTVVSTDDQPVSTGGSINTIPGTSAFLGSVTVQRTMEGKGSVVNRYVSSPVTGAIVSQMTTDFASAGMRWYDETVKGVASNGYKTTGPSALMVSGRGYLVTPNSATDNILWDVRGPLSTGLNQGAVDFNVTHTVSSPPQLQADGWNLVGNPYPSGISWANDAGWQRDNIGTTVYVYDMGGAAPNYKYYNYADDSGDLPSGIIAMGQSFWIYAEPDGTSVPGDAVLIVNETAKTGAAGGTFYRQKTSASKQLIVSLTGPDGSEDKTFLKLNAQATTNFDRGLDTYKFYNDNLNISLIDDHAHSLAMHTMSNLTDDITVPVAIQVANEGEYTISFRNTDAFLAGSDLYLTDMLEGTSVPVSESLRYTFYLGGASLAISDRFRLSRKPLETINSENVVELYPNPVSRVVNINLKDTTEGYVTVIDQLGKTVMAEKVSARATLDLEGLPRGFYTVRVVSKNRVVLKKIVKQ